MRRHPVLTYVILVESRSLCLRRWNAVALVGAVVSPQVVAVTSALIMISAVIALVVGGPIRLSWTFHLQLPVPKAAPS